MRCRACGTAQLTCRPHLEWLRAGFERRARRSRVITCTSCGMQGKTFEQIAEVMPL